MVGVVMVFPGQLKVAGMLHPLLASLWPGTLLEAGADLKYEQMSNIYTVYTYTNHVEYKHCYKFLADFAVFD